MNIETRVSNAQGIRISVKSDDVEIGRAYLYIMHNDLHDRPFGLMEDVYDADSHRGQGVGSELVRTVVATAREANCYKLIATSRTSRSNVHALYQKLGFALHGIEFRIDF